MVFLVCITLVLNQHSLHHNPFPFPDLRNSYPFVFAPFNIPVVNLANLNKNPHLHIPITTLYIDNSFYCKCFQRAAIATIDGFG